METNSSNTFTRKQWRVNFFSPGGKGEGGKKYFFQGRTRPSKAIGFDNFVRENAVFLDFTQTWGRRASCWGQDILQRAIAPSPRVAMPLRGKMFLMIIIKNNGK